MHESTIDIDTKLNTVIQQLRTMENSHPNIVKLWQTYLNRMVENIKDELENCETMMGIANNGVTDIDMDTLLFLCYRPFHEESNEA
tara:strand:+ start:210 stop:467 length:258 start_codon:yes stop_codon:yes gene_type:complete